MSRRPTLTAAIITLNEEQNLPLLLDRLDFVHEVVIVDGGSQDATLSIARARACCVTSRRFESFAEQRNHALRLATSDWVLAIDADERPTPQWIAELNARIAGDEAAFRLPIRSQIFGRNMRFGGTQGDIPIRLVRRTAGQWQGQVHERFVTAGRVGQFDSWLEHRTLPDLAAFLAKMNRYTSLAAEERVVRGLPPRTHDLWLRPASEVFRRLFWKQGWLDGPQGWAFAFLSGLSEWVGARKHRQLWQEWRQELATAVEQGCAVEDLLPTARLERSPSWSSGVVLEERVCDTRIDSPHAAGPAPRNRSGSPRWGESFPR